MLPNNATATNSNKIYCSSCPPDIKNITSKSKIINDAKELWGFNEKTTEILSSWSCLVYTIQIFKELFIVKEYFIKKWFTLPFNNWKIFNYPSGYVTTNNPEDSFNKQF